MDARSVEERKEKEPALSPPRFLIVRFSAIGDCVMAAWATTAIRNRFPDAFICWAVEERCSPVIDRKRLVDKVVEIPRERWRGKKASPTVLREQIAICDGLRRLKFDYGFDLQGHLKTALCLRFAFPRKRVSVGATDSVSRLLNPVPARMPEQTHWVDWHIRTFHRGRADWLRYQLLRATLQRSIRLRNGNTLPENFNRMGFISFSSVAQEIQRFILTELQTTLESCLWQTQWRWLQRANSTWREIRGLGTSPLPMACR